MFALLNPIQRVKRLWHRELVSHPVTHAWVLNLYRAGERYPETVTDYFPAHLAPWTWLRESMESHRDDEHRHVAMFTTLLRSSGQPVSDALTGDDVFNHVIRRCTPDAKLDTSSTDPKRLQLAHFLAHAHHLERRIAQSQEYHLEACETVGNHRVAKAMAVVLRDELRHVAYTRNALFELVPTRIAHDVMNLHAKSEARADLLFSQRQVRHFLRQHSHLSPTHHRLLFRVCAWLQETAAHHV